MLALKDNAISRCLAEHGFIDHYGKDLAKKKCDAMLSAHPLNDDTDAPLPKWAINIMKDKSVGYRTRIKIVMTHHWDITGENPSWRFVQPSEMKSAPPKQPPEWLEKFRESKKAVARDYLLRKQEEKENNK